MSGALHGVLLHGCAHVRVADRDMATGPEMAKRPIQHGGRNEALPLPCRATKEAQNGAIRGSGSGGSSRRGPKGRVSLCVCVSVSVWDMVGDEED
jgi:hypothetical protein